MFFQHGSLKPQDIKQVHTLTSALCVVLQTKQQQQKNWFWTQYFSFTCYPFVTMQGNFWLLSDLRARNMNLGILFQIHVAKY